MPVARVDSEASGIGARSTAAWALLQGTSPPRERGVANRGQCAPARLSWQDQNWQGAHRFPPVEPEVASPSEPPIARHCLAIATRCFLVYAALMRDQLLVRYLQCNSTAELEAKDDTVTGLRGSGSAVRIGVLFGDDGVATADRRPADDPGRADVASLGDFPVTQTSVPFAPSHQVSGRSRPTTLCRSIPRNLRPSLPHRPGNQASDLRLCLIAR